MTPVLVVFAFVIVSVVILAGYLSSLSYKERRELNNRLMCSTVDEYLKMTSAGEEIKSSAQPVSAHRKMVSEFKARGVIDR